MSSVILSYDERNTEARQQLSMLLSTGLFIQQPYTAEDLKQHRDEIDTFFIGSRKSMASVIARNV